MRILRTVELYLALGFFLAAGEAGVVAQQASPDLFIKEHPSIWVDGVGGGFQKGANEIGLSGGAGYGMQTFGSRANHHWWLAAFDYGTMLSGVAGKGRWWEGNLELIGEVFGGEQFHPDNAYLVGGGPHLRYNFATGTRWVPFFHIGIGLTGTDIRNGDLSTDFEFNLQVGGGVRYFVRDDLALSVQYRLIHISNAGIDAPNLGVNNSTLYLGLSYFW